MSCPKRHNKANSNRRRRTVSRALAFWIAVLGLATAMDAAAQLDETWLITVRGQTVVPEPDGSFVVRNISAPDDFGPEGPGSPRDNVSDDFVRLTGVSTAGGVTRYVFSEPFQIVQGQAVFIATEDLVFTDIPPPLPDRIMAMPDEPVLTEIGATTQVRVTATLADGSEVDVTPQIVWTTYRSSNPAIATVSVNGLVTARGAGSVFITASNEGASSVTRILVSPGDPLTAVEGLVRLENGTPVEGALINIPEQGRTATTDSTGMYAIGGLATTFGDTVTVTARLSTAAKQLQPGLFLIGAAVGVPLLPGGISDAGIITLIPIGTVDGDEDGVPDNVEVFLGYDPLNDDTDDDGMPDGSEDAESDGVPDWVEFVLDFDPQRDDTDGDDVPDAQEDTDGDGIPDAEEVALGLNPYAIDTDGDGFGDGEEIDAGADPLNPLHAPVGLALAARLSYQFFSNDTQGGAPVHAASQSLSFRYFAPGAEGGGDALALGKPVSYRYFAPGSQGGGDALGISMPLSYRYFSNGAEGNGDAFSISDPLSFRFFSSGADGLGAAFQTSEGLSYEYD